MSTQFFHVKFPAWVLEKCTHINQLECIVLTLALTRWAELFHHKKLQFFCDNQTMVIAVNSGSSRDVLMQACLRQIHKVMAIESVDVRAIFLRGQDNRIADSLSR